LGFRQSKNIWNISITSASGTAIETHPMVIENSFSGDKAFGSVNLTIISPISIICGPLFPRFYYRAFFHDVSRKNN
jgi:hypothetical protein